MTEKKRLNIDELDGDWPKRTQDIRVPVKGEEDLESDETPVEKSSLEIRIPGLCK